MPSNAATLDAFEGERAQAAGVELQRLTYPTAVRAEIDSLPRGTWLFSDFDLLDPIMIVHAARLWSRLSERGDRLLNHPTRSMRRYELLRTLHEERINDFDVYLATDPRRPRRYPVFARWANAHSGPISPLMRNRAMLERYLARTLEVGRPRDGLLIVEHCDTREPSGLVREHGAFRIGDRIFPEHLWFSEEWAIKLRASWQLGDRPVDRMALLAEEERHYEQNPHEAALRRIFELARIEYGRIDYGIRDGRIQVWEINGNPEVSFDCWVSLPERDAGPLRARFAERFGAAMAAIDTP